MSACPICDGELKEAISEEGRLVARVNCHTCGEHRVMPLASLGHLPPFETNRPWRARLAHGLTKVPNGSLVSLVEMEKLAETTTLPGALERIENLVLHLAEDFDAGQWVGLYPVRLWARLGCLRSDEAAWVLDQAGILGYIARSRENEGLYCLSAGGWERHAELVRNGARSKHAFMAMKFGDDVMDRVFADHLRPAVAQTGFDLRTTVGDHQTAGSIDNRMRVEIRTSRFVLCDLTHGNQGAYWEAGFAEGLGRPVIYTCRSDMHGRPGAVHFDTDHQLIIRWDPADMSVAMQELKATIRATLPAEAKLQDS